MHDKKFISRILEILATFGYTGYFPYASGTAGTFGAMLSFYLICLWLEKFHPAIDPGILAFALTLVFLVPSVRIAHWAEKEYQTEDPSYVVIDEVLGFWISIAFLPFDLRIWLLAFFIFRTLDILKPFPAYISQEIGNGWGIIVDDLIAGLYANIILRLFITWGILDYI